MKLAQTTATTIDTPAPASFTCAECPFARHIDGNRYCCQVSQTASDVKRGHWEATVSCFEALAAAEAEKVASETEAPIAQTDTTEKFLSAPATVATVATVAAPTAPTPATLPVIKSAAPVAPIASGPDDEPPHRGDNGRGRVQPATTKKLLPAIIPIARCTSDIPAANFDQHELEIAGELSLSLGGFIYPPVVRREGSGYKVLAGHFQYHAATLARKLNPRSGETIPAFIIEADTEAALLAQVEILKARKF